MILFRENIFRVSESGDTVHSILLQIKRSRGFGHKSKVLIMIENSDKYIFGIVNYVFLALVSNTIHSLIIVLLSNIVIDKSS